MEKPLHVRVAEALGWTKVEKAGGLSYWGARPGKEIPDFAEDIPRYDTDWSATGPLIEKHGIELACFFPGDLGQDGFVWKAWRSHDDFIPQEETRVGEGATPLVAICNLILALKEAGKL